MRRHHWSYLVIVLTVALSLIVSCQAAPAPTQAPQPTAAPNASAASGPTIDRIKKAGKLVVLQDATFRPMEFKDESGKIVGFDVDVAQAFADSLGVKLEVQNVNWDGIFVALQAGKGDAIFSSVTITDKRKEQMAFSEPYYLAGQMIAVPADNTDIKGPDDLKGKAVAVQIDTTGQEAAEGIDGIKEIRKFDGGAETMMAVDQKKVDASIMDSVVVLDYVKNHPTVKTAGTKPFTTEPYGAAFNKDATDLVKAFNDFLAAAQKDGTMDKILDKWGMKTS
ncbi:MAG: basic amino acid ABC transporter substrate-binding protein [Dehalococcoidales bacterium]|nr:basic amino acid ABC transporter substrate-binding protein [Dehalococcoidales bacterium]